MMFIDAIVECNDSFILCASSTSAMAVAAGSDGSVDAPAGMELMAQAAAAYAGVNGQRAGAAPRKGLLLGTRRCAVHTPRFLPGQRLLVRAASDGAAGGAHSFDCEITDAADQRLLMAARIYVLVLDEEAGDLR